ncbi:MAG: hypothetical protein U0401_17335 [Anaerolineae bacterium]
MRNRLLRRGGLALPTLNGLRPEIAGRLDYFDLQVFSLPGRPDGGGPRRLPVLTSSWPDCRNSSGPGFAFETCAKRSKPLPQVVGIKSARPRSAQPF